MHKEFIPSGSLYKIFTGLVSRTESMWSIYKGEMAFTKDVFNCLNKKASINEWATERFIRESAVLLRMLMGRPIQNKCPQEVFSPGYLSDFPSSDNKSKEAACSILTWFSPISRAPAYGFIILDLSSHYNHHWQRIALVTVEPAGKASFVYNCVQTRLMRQYNGMWTISLG